MPFVGSDWRSPGDKWIRTEFGWKRLADIRNNLNIQLVQHLRHLSSSSSSLSVVTTTSSNSTTNNSSRTSSRQLSRRGSPVGDAQARPQNGGKKLKVKSKGSGDSKASCSHQSKKREAKQGAWEREQRLRQLQLMLDQRCVSARTSSRESNHYSTISDAISKLNFHQALHDENCFPFVCKVIKLLLENYYWTLSGSTQTALLRITDTAKDIAIETRMHSGLVLKMTEAALTTLDKGRRQQMMGFGVRSIDSKIKSLLKTKKQLQEQMLEHPCPLKPGDMEFTKLPTDCLRLIVSHLSHPRDVLNLGLADVRLLRVTEESWVWRELTQHHYGEVNLRRCRPETDESANYMSSWKHIFIQKYKDTRGRLKGEMFRAVCLCTTCSYVYWKDYGHPCSGQVQTNANAAAVEDDDADSAAAAASGQQEAQGLTAEQFLHLFIR